MGIASVFRGSRAAAITLVLLVSVVVLVAQTVVDPHMAEFDPSPQHHDLASDGTPVVESYVLALYLVGDSTPFETVTLGKPHPDPDGKIRIDFINLLSTMPAPGVLYEARVSAVGAGGTAVSALSNAFSFSAPCAPSLTTAGLSVPASGGTGSVGMDAGDGCIWTAVSNAAWITITAGSSGSGAGTISFAVAPNSGAASRTGTITAGGGTFTVTQAGAACTYSLSSSNQSVPAGGGSVSVTMTADTACSWSASSDSAWLTVTSGGSGSGSGTISLSVAANPDTSSRTGTITAGGQIFTVTQAGAPCTYALVPTAQSMPAAGGTGNVGVTAGAGCTWTATSNVAWVSVTSAAGVGDGAISFSVAANPSTSPRTGTITAGGHTVTVTQAGAGCTYALAPASASIPAAGGAGTVTMTASPDCSWTASSSAPWITVTGGAGGSGNGTITYAVAANSTAEARTGTITAGGQTVTVTQAGAPCTYVAAPTGQSVPAEGGTAAVAMSATAGCTWTATSNAEWITLPSSASGSGDGTVAYSVAANASGEGRTGTISVGGQTVTVTQAGAACTYALVPMAQSLPAEGGTGTVMMTGTVDCSWTASSQAAWITITGGASGAGGGTISFSVAPNPDSARTGTITAGGQTFTVSQAGVPCTYTLARTSQIHAAPADAATVDVASGADCAWGAVSNVGWVTITSGASGAGPGTISYSVAENTASSWRTGTLTIAGQRYTVSQAGVPCSFVLDSPSGSAPTSGGTGTVSITANADCYWLASSQVSWMTITSGTSGSGSRTISFSVAPNPGTSSRTGTLTIGGQTFTVTQDGASGCAYVLAPTSGLAPASGGTATVGITAHADCSWAAVSNVGWATVTNGASGAGAGTITYSVAPNPGASRSGTLSIGGQTFTLTQEAGEACAYALSSTSQIFAAAGGAASVGIKTHGDCSWAAVSNIGWATITNGASGAGAGTVTYSVAPNPGTTWRTGTLTIGGQQFTVSQAGVPCTFVLDATSASMPASGGTGTVNLTATTGCFWVASSQASWMTITSGTSGSGSRTFSFTVAPNTGTASRIGTLLIAGQTFTVTQAAQ